MYVKQNWQTGDVVTSAKLNHMEDGIAGGGVLVVTSDGTALDKTWQEIHDAMPAVWVTNETGTLFNPVVTAFGGEGNYGVGVWNYQQQNASMYVAESADGYPSFTE